MSTISRASPELTIPMFIHPSPGFLPPPPPPFTVRPLFPESGSKEDFDSSAAPFDYYDHDSDQPENVVTFFRYDPFLNSGNPNLFELKSDDESARVRVDMPGVDKSGLKLWLENGQLKIVGKGPEEEDGAAGPEKAADAREYDVTVELLDNEILKKEEAVAEMKNGVLQIVIPKKKSEEGKNVVNVKVT